MFSYGTMIAFIATLDPILKSMNYEDSNQTTAITILCAMLIGILATPIFSIIIKKTKKYKLVTSLSKYFVNSRHHRLLRIFGSDNLCIYVESQEWCCDWYPCWFSRILLDSQCFIVFGLFSWSHLPDWWRFSRWILVCRRSNIRCSFRCGCDQCHRLKSALTFTNLPDFIRTLDDICLFRSSSDKGRS